MTLQTIDNLTSNKFCGPGAIAAITGESLDLVDSRCRKITGRNVIKGMYFFEVESVLDSFGIKSNTRVQCLHRTSLYQLLCSNQLVAGVYIIQIPGHFICLEKVINSGKVEYYYLDNRTKQTVSASSSVYLGKPVLLYQRFYKG